MGLEKWFCTLSDRLAHLQEQPVTSDDHETVADDEGPSRRRSVDSVARDQSAVEDVLEDLNNLALDPSLRRCD